VRTGDDPKRPEPTYSVDTPMHGRPTLLVFSRGASAESARRRLLPGRLRHLEDETHRELLEAALEAGRDAGCALAISSPRPLCRPAIEHLPQRGADFGTRLESAVDLAFARGPELLLVAAADVPGLTAEHIGQAVVAARWCRRSTRRDLERSLRLAGREVVRLAPLCDLDRPADLAGWLTRGASGVPLRLARLAGLLLRAFATLRPGMPLDLGRTLAGVAPRCTGRAPPAVSLLSH
jgi:hypothetical protein